MVSLTLTCGNMLENIIQLSLEDKTLKFEHNKNQEDLKALLFWNENMQCLRILRLVSQDLSGFWVEFQAKVWDLVS